MFDFKTESVFIDTDSRGTDDLCKMCGKCCLAITTEFSHDKLIEMAKTKEKEAQVFVDFFKQYDSIEDARKVVPDQVEQILEFKKECNKDPNETNFYYCSYINDKNMCTIHEERPICCRTAPANGWSLMPPECGYEGWQFEQKERIKATVRELKEGLYEAEMLLAPDEVIPDMDGITVNELKNMVTEKIKYFKQYGSADW